MKNKTQIDKLIEIAKGKLIVAETLKRLSPDVAERLAAQFFPELAGSVEIAPSTETNGKAKVIREPLNPFVTNKEVLISEIRRYGWKWREETLRAKSTMELRGLLEKYKLTKKRAMKKRLKTLAKKSTDTTA